MTTAHAIFVYPEFRNATETSRGSNTVRLPGQASTGHNKEAQAPETTVNRGSPAGTMPNPRRKTHGGWPDGGTFLPAKQQTGEEVTMAAAPTRGGDGQNQG